MGRASTPAGPAGPGQPGRRAGPAARAGPASRSYPSGIRASRAGPFGPGQAPMAGPYGAGSAGRERRQRARPARRPDARRAARRPADARAVQPGPAEHRIVAGRREQLGRAGLPAREGRPNPGSTGSWQAADPAQGPDWAARQGRTRLALAGRPARTAGRRAAPGRRPDPRNTGSWQAAGPGQGQAWAAGPGRARRAQHRLVAGGRARQGPGWPPSQGQGQAARGQFPQGVKNTGAWQAAGPVPGQGWAGPGQPPFHGQAQALPGSAISRPAVSRERRRPRSGHARHRLVRPGRAARSSSSATARCPTRRPAARARSRRSRPTTSPRSRATCGCCGPRSDSTTPTWRRSRTTRCGRWRRRRAGSGCRPCRCSSPTSTPAAATSPTGKSAGTGW